MKFLATISNAFAIAAIVLLNFVVFAGHASAVSTASHETHGGSHYSTTQSPACIALCTTATLKDEREVKLTDEEQDDEPVPPKSLPFYATLSGYLVPKKLANGYTQNQLVLRPPDLVKLYSNYRF